MILLKLFGLWRWLKEALLALLGLVRRYPLQASLIVSMCLAGWLWQARNAEQAKVSDLTDLLMSERAEYARAREEAERLHREARADAEHTSKELAHAADATARHLDADSRRNLAERVRQAPGCSPGPAIATTVPDNSQSDFGTNPTGVYVTLAEADALRRHEVRSVTCEGWALDLIARGLAVE